MITNKLPCYIPYLMHLALEEEEGPKPKSEIKEYDY